MKYRKTLLTGLILTMIIGTASAVQITSLETNSTVTPGEDQKFADFNVSVNSTVNMNEITISDNFPFNTSSQELSRYNSTLVGYKMNVSPASSFAYGNYSRSISVVAGNQTASVNSNFTVEKLNKWNLSNSSVPTTLNTGDEEIIDNITVEQLGNVDSQFETSINGNVSSIVSVTPSFKVYKNIPYELSLNSFVSDSKPPGTYTGDILLNQQGYSQKKNVSLSIEVIDDEKPEIRNTLNRDVEVDEQQTFKISTLDNVGINKVNATVKRFVNTTNESAVNKTVSKLSFNKGEADSVYLQDDTYLQTGKYYINYNVYDSSGNKADETQSFEVEKLDAIDLSSQTISVDEVVKGETKKIQVFELNKPANVLVDFKGFTPENASVNVALKKEDAAASMPFKSDGSNRTVTETGNYFLEITAQEGESSTDFNGELEYIYKELNESQVVKEQNQFFEGTTISNYPEPENTTVEGVVVNTYYEYNENETPETVNLQVSRDASVCLGKEEIDDCITSVDVGKIEEQGEKIAALSGAVTLRNYLIGFVVLVFSSYILVSRRISKMAGLQSTKFQMDYGFSKHVPNKSVSKWDPNKHLDDR